MDKKKYFYIKIDLVTDDIIAVADTPKELAELCGVKRTSILETMSRAKRRGWRCCYLKIEDDEDE